jgi:hypothetical protein
MLCTAYLIIFLLVFDTIHTIHCCYRRRVHVLEREQHGTMQLLLLLQALALSKSLLRLEAVVTMLLAAAVVATSRSRGRG